jgi:hypothetical protein
VHHDDAEGNAEEEADCSEGKGGMSALVCVCGQGVKVVPILPCVQGDSAANPTTAVAPSSALSSAMSSAPLRVGAAIGLSFPSSIFQVSTVMLPTANGRRGGGAASSAAGRAVDCVVVAASLTGAGPPPIVPHFVDVT